MNTNKSLVLASILLSSISMSVSAEQTPEKLFNGTFSGSLELATDYVFRGESEVADGDVPAVKGSFTWTHDSGVYAGLYGATNKFESTPDIYAVLGPYIGKFGKIGDTGFSYNAFVFHYTYPGADDDLDYTELWLEVSKDFGPVNVKFELTPTLNDWFGVDGWKGVNYAIHPSKTFSNGLKLSGAIGYQDLDGNNAEGWTHWNIGVSKEFYGLTFDVRYHDTDVDSSHKVYGSEQGQKIFDDRVVLAVQKSF